MCNNSIFTKEYRANLIQNILEAQLENIATNVDLMQFVEEILLDGYECKGLNNLSDKELLRLGTQHEILK